MEVKKVAAKSVVWSMYGNAFNQTINFAIFIFLARALSVEEFGLLAICLLMIEFSSVFQSFGLHQQLISQKKWNNSLASTAFWVALIVSGGISILILLFGVPVAYFYHSSLAANCFLLLSLFPLLQGCRQVHASKLQRDFKFKLLSIVESVAVFFGGTITVSLAFMDFGVWSLIIGRLVQQLVELTIIFSSSGFSPSFELQKSYVVKIKNYGLPLLISNNVIFISRKALQIIIGLLMGPAALAIINVAQRPLDVIRKLIIEQFNKIFFASLRQIPQQKIPDVFYRALSMTSFVFLPTYLGIGAIAELFVELALSPEWQNVVIPLNILVLIGPSIVLGGGIIGSILNNSGHTKASSKITIIWCIVNLAAITTGAFFGITYAAAASVLANYLMLPIRYYILSKYADIKLNTAVKSVFPYAASSIVMFIFVLLILSELNEFSIGVFSKLITVIGCGASIYFFTLYLFFESHLKSMIFELKQLLTSNKALL